MKIIKKIIILVAAFILLFSASASASTDINFGFGYIPYTYNYLQEPVASPNAFEVVKTLTGYDFGDLPFNDISDITYNGKDLIYIADSGNNRVIITNKEFDVIKIIDKFEYKGEMQTFNMPSSVAYANGKFYIADTKNSRIVIFDEKQKVALNILNRPTIALLANGYNYQPAKIAVDYAGRIYIIAKGINQGLIQLDENGEFMGFMGAPRVVPKFDEIVFRKFFPKQIINKLIKFVPTEYNSVNISDSGFLYVTSQSSNIPPIAVLNGQGENILKVTYAYPKGDGNYIGQDGIPVSSMFVDIIPRDDGGYFALDANKGRIFCYDNRGVLLYLLGNIGSQNGSFYSPAAIEYIDGKIIVIDKGRDNINEFTPTEFGENVDKAIALHIKGDYKNEKQAWDNVLNLNSNYDIANINLARNDIQNGKSKEAMDKLSFVGEKKYYSMAFKDFRSDFIRSNFYLIFVIIVLLILSFIFIPKFVKRTRFYKRIISKSLYKQLKFGLYVMFHPFDGFWDLKREKRGSFKAAIILLLVFSGFYAISKRYSGYLFMSKPYNSVNILFELGAILIPFILWIVSNWCFTTLMDGEGSIKDIFISSSYALMPYIILSPVLFIMSHLLSGEEAPFYTYLNSFAILWVLILVFWGMMVTHDYPLGKSFLTLVLTLIGICLIIFLALLFINLIQEIYAFFYNIYKEIAFRFY